MIRPREVDEQTRQRDLSLADVRRAIPRSCFKLDPLRSWGTLARVAGCAAICLWLLAHVPLTGGTALLWQLPVLTMLWTIYGWVLVGAFLIGHDCGHGSFSSKPWINNVVGWICMMPLANSFYAWKVTHERHHAYTQLRGHDVDWACFLVTERELESRAALLPLITRVGYAVPCGIFLWIAWNTIRRAAMTHKMFTSGRLARVRARLVASNIAMGLCLAGLYAGLWNAYGFLGMLKYHGIPATVAMVTSWIIITIQHANEQTLWYEPQGWTPLRGQLVSTFDIRFPRWLEYLWCDGNIHIPHHVAATIPWYHLKRAGRAIQAAYPAYYQEERFTLSHLRWLWRTPFLESVSDKNYYVLSSQVSR